MKDLKEMVENGLVSVQKHPKEDLYIYNYTNRVQYESLWNEITLQTRGLILDGEGNIVCRPFKKFFNLEEHQEDEIPNEAFDVYEKMDGSLGILYWVDNKPFIASRGSFISEQAARATEILYNKYQQTFDLIDKYSTYLFEIIYPENRIVVNYGDTEDLVLLSIINNLTGEERLDDIGFPLVKKYDGVKDFRQLREKEEDNKEGFVIRFKNGFRVKMKYAEYVRLHRIITGVSNKAIWEYLSNGDSLELLLDRVPDEFYEWVKATEMSLKGQYTEILNECLKGYKELNTRKETALYFQTQKHPSVLFAMLDGKDVKRIIWRMVRPTFSKAFNINE